MRNQQQMPQANEYGEIVVNGVTYDANEVYDRTILIYGAQATDFEQHDFTTLIVLHTNIKEANGIKAGGKAPADYRYGSGADTNVFNEHKYPYYIDTKMVTTSDKKGNPIQIVLFADFASVKEMVLVERKPKQAQPIKPKV